VASATDGKKTIKEKISKSQNNVMESRYPRGLKIWDKQSLLEQGRLKVVKSKWLIVNGKENMVAGCLIKYSRSSVSQFGVSHCKLQTVNRKRTIKGKVTFWLNNRTIKQQSNRK